LKYGHSDISNGTGFNGCYSTHIVLRKGTHIIKLPDHIIDTVGATINCALATMVNAIGSIPYHVRSFGKKALIQGDGMLGLYGITLLKEKGFEEVYCSGHHQATREDLIKSFGGIALTDGKLLLISSTAINNKLIVFF
jgi:D-arabinose 1-dehydrogenase-like Zn-dependent alcohol dehydrogenase